MTQLMNDIDPEHLDQEGLAHYESCFHSNEIKSLFEAMITLLNNFKYSN